MIATDPISEPPERGCRVSNGRAQVVSLHIINPAELDFQQHGRDKP